MVFRKGQDYVYGKGEYRGTFYKSRHFLRHRNKASKKYIFVDQEVSLTYVYKQMQKNTINILHYANFTDILSYKNIFAEGGLIYRKQVVTS